MKTSLSVCLLVLALAGCAVSRPAVERQSFLIQPERLGPAAGQPLGGALRIGGVRIAAPFDGRPWLYRRDDVRYETDFYNEFAADPALMLAEAATGWFRRSGLFRQVLPSSAAAVAAYRLETSVSAMYVDFQTDPPAAVLTLRWQLLREGNAESIVELDCEQRVALPERSPAGAARAYREAVQQALARLETALARAGI